MSGFFNTSVTALNAAQSALVTTGHNIANVNTPGYHRQAVVQSTLTPLFSGSGFFGQGVQIDTVRRIYSEFLDTQVAQAQAQASYYAAYQGEVSRIDKLLADPATGLTPALQDFFAGVQDVAANPASIASRQALVSSAGTLVSRFHLLDGALDSMRESVNAQLGTTVTSINAYARQIADLNVRIVAAQTNPNQPPNDLLDQRDRLVESLNELVGTTVVRQDDGSYNVFVGSGQSLVMGRLPFQLTTQPSTEDPRDLDLAYVSGAGAVRVPGSSFQSGSLGGLLAFRSGVLTDAQNALGRVAAGLAQTFNDQHRLGQDLNGTLGGNFFTPPQPVVAGRTTNTGNGVVSAAISNASALTGSNYRLAVNGANYVLTRLSDGASTTYGSLPQTVDGLTIDVASGTPANGDSFLIQPTRHAANSLAVAITNASRVAAAAPIRTASGAANAGSAAISAGTVNVPPPPNVNLQQPVTITFTGAGTFNVNGTGTGNPTGIAYTTGADITYNGWTVRISGTPTAGDTFTIGPNTGGVADNRNVALLAALQSANTLAGGTTSYQGAYGQMVSLVGAKTHEVDIGAQAQNSILDHARAKQQSISGVNLDEEAANLLRYQQAYQAAGKMIQVGQTLFNSLLDITGR